MKKLTRTPPAPRFTGLVSSLPYAAQLIFERGFIYACIEFFQQLVAGMVPFSFFRMQVWLFGFSEGEGDGGSVCVGR